MAEKSSSVSSADTMWLRVFRGEDRNKNTQKCHVSCDTFVTLNFLLGSPVLIQTDGYEYICSIWPNSDLKDDGIQLQKIVYRKLNETFSENDADRTYAVRQLKSYSVSCVHLTIVVNSVETVQEFKQTMKSGDTVKNMCVNCLYKLWVTEGFVVDLQHSRPGALYGISKLVINACQSEQSTNTKYTDKDIRIDAAVSSKLTDAQTAGREMCKSLTDIVDKSFQILPDADIVIDKVISKERFSYLSNKVLSPVGGLDTVANELIDLVQLSFLHQSYLKHIGMNPPKGILLRGPPGAGKTSLVRFVANHCEAFLITINGPEIFGPHPGDTEENLRQVFQRASLASAEGACVLFIDEVDSLCPRRGKSGGLQEARVTAQLLTLMDKATTTAGLVVIGATNRPSALDPAVRRPGRLDREIMINVPTIQQRFEILKVHSCKLKLSDDVDLDLLADLTNGYVGADLASLCHEAAYLAMSSHISKEKFLQKICQSHFLSAMKKVIPSLQKGAEGLVDLRPVHWEQIGGLEAVKIQIQQAVEWPIKHPEAFTRLGLPCPKGVLLYGPPGCCKTTLVRAAATSCHATFLSISGAQLYSPYVGDSERLIAEVFQRARAGAPSIIFLDELDSIVGKRSESSQRGVQERVLSALLNEMDGVGVRLDDKVEADRSRKMAEGDPGQAQDIVREQTENLSVLVVAATNRPDLLDEALVRPGRMDRIVYVPHPDKQARLEILHVLTSKMPVTDVDLEKIAADTELYTGADLENLCREAALFSLTENLEAVSITSDHFCRALEYVKPSLTSEMIQTYSMLKMATFGTIK